MGFVKLINIITAVKFSYIEHWAQYLIWYPDILFQKIDRYTLITYSNYCLVSE